MTRYVRAQRQVLAMFQQAIGSSSRVPDLIANVILRRPSCLPLAVQCVHIDSPAASTSTSTRSVAEGFTSEAYASMTKDVHRNACYQAWIDSARQPGHGWLEIGPGSDACLALMVLAAHPDTSYCGIEVNKTAAHQASKRLRSYRRARIVRGFIDEHFKALPLSVDCILHEVFGTIASAEGIARTMVALRQRFPKAQSIPEAAATYMVPLALTADDVLKDPTLTINHKLIRGRLPFARRALTSDHALLEWLDFRDSPELTQHHTTVCRVRCSGLLTAVGLYIWIGPASAAGHGAMITSGDLGRLGVRDSRDLGRLGVGDSPDIGRCGKGDSRDIGVVAMATTTSNQDLPGASTNWANVALVLPQPMTVEQDRVIVLTAAAHLDSVTPCYEVTVDYAGRRHQWHVGHHDLFGSYVYLHALTPTDRGRHRRRR